MRQRCTATAVKTGVSRTIDAEKSPSVAANRKQSTMFAADRDGAKLHFRGQLPALIIERSSSKVEEESFHKPA